MSAAHPCDQEKWLRSLPLPQMFLLARQAGCRFSNVQVAIDDLMMRSHEKLRALVAAHPVVS